MPIQSSTVVFNHKYPYIPKFKRPRSDAFPETPLADQIKNTDFTRPMLPANACLLPGDICRFGVGETQNSDYWLDADRSLTIGDP